MPPESLALQVVITLLEGGILDVKDEMGTEINCFGLRKGHWQEKEKPTKNLGQLLILLYSSIDGVILTNIVRSMLSKTEVI
jgi:hypothetical protein